MGKIAKKYLLPALMLSILLGVYLFLAPKEPTNISADARAIVNSIESSALAIIATIWMISLNTKE